MIFSDNKYTRWYFSIITQTRQNQHSTEVYTENHHIIPECFFIKNTRNSKHGILDGDPNKSDNKIRLTAKEHFVCHHLLIKMVSDPGQLAQMKKAWAYMRYQSIHQKRYKINARLFEKMRIAASEAQSVFGKEQVMTGIHNFLGGEIQRKSNAARIKSGTHHLTTKEFSELSRDRENKKVEAGSHSFLDSKAASQRNIKRINDGTHNWIKRADGSSQSSDLVKEGTHHFVTNNPVHNLLTKGTHASKIKLSCIFCRRQCSKNNFNKQHGTCQKIFHVDEEEVNIST